MILSVKYNATFYSPHECSKKLETTLFNFKKEEKGKSLMFINLQNIWLNKLKKLRKK
ncbi:hypothetical protein Ga0061079_10186 [Apibacter mensalis]|uniref:Uncharacterized protein n=1 Tax=Apibacter mensalis TaxID=1586267 RepID=A0A0X3ALS3_9FLAO|nr:hypothetical protein [Apibacter mensalis]CVK15274.1 hypothetical protein Ga0061079_10186 [Apibacter mensalis]